MIRVALLACALLTLVAASGQAGPGKPVIAYTAGRSLTDYSIYTIAPGGGERRNVGSGYLYVEYPYPAWSRDGRRVAFPSGGLPITIVDRTGAGLRRIGRGFDDNVRYSMSWAPNGRRIALEAESNLWLVDVGSGIARAAAPPGRFPVFSPDGSRIAYFEGNGAVERLRLALLRSDGSGLKRTTLRTWFAAAPSWSPDGRRVVLESGEDVVVYDVVSGRSTNLTHSSVPETFPAWSPNGRWIVFIRGKRKGSSLRPGVVVVRPDGSDMRLLANARLGPGSPIWSPDSRRVAFVGGHRTIFGAPRAYVVGIQGGSVRSLFAPLCGRDSIAGLTWGRGGRLAFASTVNDSQVYRAATDGSNARLLAGSCAEERAPAWSPNGRSIAYERDLELFVMREDGAGKRRLATGGAPTWSPDGSRIVFSRPAARGRLYSIATAGGPEQPLTADARSQAPDWSAAVDRIAFTRTENKLEQVYTMRPDGSDVRRVTLLGGSYPTWAPGGERIAYVYKSNVWTIAPDGADPKRLTAYDECTEVTDPSWSREGTTIAFTIYSNDEETGGIAFVPASGGPVRWGAGSPFYVDPNDGGRQASAPTWRPGSPAAARSLSGPRSDAQASRCIRIGG